MNMHRIQIIGCLLISLIVLGGCQSDIALSRAVRKGDTIVVSLGDANPLGSNSNLKSTMIRETDITAGFLDSTWNTFPVKVRHVFRVYGDPTAANSSARGQAQWMAVIDLVHPTNNTKPNLALGPGAIYLDSTKFKNRQTIKTEILAGVGSPHPFLSQNDSYNTGIDKVEFVKPAMQALVSVSGTLPQGVKLAGAQYRFDVPAIFTTDLIGNRVEAIAPAKLPTKTQVYFEFSRKERQAPLGTEVVVALTSTEGVDQSGMSEFNFVLTSDQSAIANAPNYWPNKLVDATFYDTHGREIPGLRGSIGKSE